MTDFPYGFRGNQFSNSGEGLLPKRMLTRNISLGALIKTSVLLSMCLARFRAAMQLASLASVTFLWSESATTLDYLPVQSNSPYFKNPAHKGSKPGKHFLFTINQDLNSHRRRRLGLLRDLPPGSCPVPGDSAPLCWYLSRRYNDSARRKSSRNALWWYAWSD